MRGGEWAFVGVGEGGETGIAVSLFDRTWSESEEGAKEEGAERYAREGEVIRN